MKRILFVVALTTLAIPSHAGSFGGPPPFTNGSPLQSGVDGSYQAVARADGVTGVIRFAYSGGSQTSTEVDSPLSNRYAFFAEGLAFVGPVTASIQGSTLGGVLEIDTQTNSLGIPNSFSNTRMTGEFNGKIDTSSSNYSFSGTGFLQTFIEDPPASDTFIYFFGKKFKFTGVRNSLTVPSAT